MPLTRLQIVKLLPSAEALYAKYINLPQLFSFHSKQQCHASHSGSLHSINATQNHIILYQAIPYNAGQYDHLTGQFDEAYVIFLIRMMPLFTLH